MCSWLFAPRVPIRGVMAEFIVWADQPVDHTPSSWPPPELQVMIGFVRRFDPSYRDAFEKVGKGAIGRPFMVRSQTCDKNDPDGFFVRFAPTSGGLFLDCSVHDIDLARWLLGNPRPKRVFASGTIAIHEGLRECGDIDNGVGICEFEDGRLAVFYASRTMAHGHDTQTEVIGTGGVLSVGHNPRANRVEIYDAGGVRNECVPTFFEVFTCGCASRNAMYAAASFSAFPSVFTDVISGVNLARSVGFEKLNDDGSAITGALATR